MPNISLSTSNLSVGYGTRVVRSDLTLSFYEGEMVCVLGANGCGKSTLLRTIAGLQPPLSGTLSPNLSALSPAERARTLSMVLTERLTLPHASIREVVAMGRYPYTSFLGSLTANDEQVVSSSLSLAGISDTDAQRPFDALSDGEKQRVMIAKALAQQTPLMLLDEPTAHLDLPSRIRTMQLLQQLAHDTQKTILVSTHELDLALRYADRILLFYPLTTTAAPTASQESRDGAPINQQSTTAESKLLQSNTRERASDSEHINHQSSIILRPSRSFEQSEIRTINCPLSQENSGEIASDSEHINYQLSTINYQLSSPSSLLAEDAFSRAFGMPLHF